MNTTNVEALQIINNPAAAWRVQDVTQMPLPLLSPLTASLGVQPPLLGFVSPQPIFFNDIILSLGRLEKHVCFLTLTPRPFIMSALGKMFSPFKSLLYLKKCSPILDL